MNILVLLAGPDQSTQADGYPLYLTEFDSVPLIQRIISNCATLGPKKIIVACRAEDVERYHLDNILSLLSPLTTVVKVSVPTEGATCTALMAVEHIDNDQELLVLNGNELLTAEWEEIIRDFRQRHLDAGVVVFPAIHPRYSYVRLDEQNHVVQAAEKNPISNHAIAGYFWFQKGSNFVRSAKDSIRKDARVNDKFYISQTLNEMILRHLTIGVYAVSGSQYRPLKSERQIDSLFARADQAVPA